MHQNTLVVVVGPTAVGKTDLCVALAKHFETVIISADSRQFYKEMAIGTAKPTTEEMKGITHYFVDDRSVTEEFNAGQFEKAALEVLESEFLKNELVVLTGGSGLYVNAICNGIDEIPAAGEGVREAFNYIAQNEGMDVLLEELKKSDPTYYEEVDLQNAHRVIRALEVCRTTGKPYSSFRTKKKKERPFNIVKIGLDRPREELYQRIDKRMDLMLEQGLMEEVIKLAPYKHLNALQTVGYKEIYDFVEGKYDWEEAVRLLKRNSRRYAKRQMTWFKKDDDTTWFHPNDFDQIIAHINHQVSGEE